MACHHHGFCHIHMPPALLFLPYDLVNWLAFPTEMNVFETNGFVSLQGGENHDHVPSCDTENEFNKNKKFVKVYLETTAYQRP